MSASPIDRAARRSLVIAALALFAVAFGAADGQAQTRPGGRPTRFQPSRPTVSPYLNLFRTDRGPIPNYHLYVRPLQQQRAFQQYQQQLDFSQSQAVRQLGEQLYQLRSTNASPTGIGAGFGNYLQYYPSYRGFTR